MQEHVHVSIGTEGNGFVVILASSFTVRPPQFREMWMGRDEGCAGESCFHDCLPFARVLQSGMLTMLMSCSQAYLPLSCPAGTRQSDDPILLRRR